MASKKSFNLTNTGNPADIFLTKAEPQEEAEPVEPKELEEPLKEAEIVQDATKLKNGYVLVKEAKSRRLQLLIRPTTHERIKREASKRNTSVNDLINEILEEHLEGSEKNGK